MRVAVVSNDNENVDEHFGKAKSFLIYDIENKTPSFMGKRETTPLSEGDPKHPFNRERFEKVYDVISDCKVVLCIQIGKRPEKELRELGVEPVVYLGAIENGLKKARDF